MKDPIIALGKHDDFLPCLLQELAPPALPAHRLPAHRLALTRQAIGRGQAAHQQREHHRHPYDARGFLQRMAQLPRWLGFLDTLGLKQTPLVIVIKGLPGRLGHRGMGQVHGVAPWPIVLPLPLAHDHGIDGVGLEGAAVGVAPML